MKKNQGRIGKKQKDDKSKPSMEWQTGEYARNGKFELLIPYQFLLLCKLMEITPSEVIRDFLDALDCASWKHQGREAGKEKIIEYFISQGYGHEQYTPQEMREIFKEMDAIGSLFPGNGNQEIMEEYSRWRDKYHVYWFEKWSKKTKVQISS